MAAINWLVETIRAFTTPVMVGGGDIDPEKLAEQIVAALPLAALRTTIEHSARTVFTQRKLFDDVLSPRGSLAAEIGRNAAGSLAFMIGDDSVQIEDSQAWTDAIRALEIAGVPAVDHNGKAMTLAERILWLHRHPWERGRCPACVAEQNPNAQHLYNQRCSRKSPEAIRAEAEYQAQRSEADKESEAAERRADEKIEERGKL